MGKFAFELNRVLRIKNGPRTTLHVGQTVTFTLTDGSQLSVRITHKGEKGAFTGSLSEVTGFKVKGSYTLIYAAKNTLMITPQ